MVFWIKAKHVILRFKRVLVRARARVKLRILAFNLNFEGVPGNALLSVLPPPLHNASMETVVAPRDVRSRRIMIVHQRVAMAWWMRARHATATARANVPRRRRAPLRALPEAQHHARRFVPNPRSLSVRQATDVARLVVLLRTTMIAHAPRARALQASAEPSTMAVVEQ